MLAIACLAAISSVRVTTALRANVLPRAVSSTMSPAFAGDRSHTQSQSHLAAEDRSKLLPCQRLSSIRHAVACIAAVPPPQFASMICRALWLLRQMRAAPSALAHRSVYALPVQDSSTCLRPCGLPSRARRARMRPNSSVEATATGRAQGPRRAASYHARRGPCALPAAAPHLKR